MGSSPTFDFLSDGWADCPGPLSEADAWYTLPYPGEGYETHGISIEQSCDPYQSVDVFFDEFDAGVVAGWLSYELVTWNHGLDRPDPSSNHPPLICLAHYPEPSDSTSSRPNDLQLGSFESETDRDHYTGAVETIRRRIEAGYVYQVNLSQRFGTSVRGRLESLINENTLDDFPPHSVYVSHGDHEILSLSPERFLHLDGDEIITQPIKGTRPRGGNPHEDNRLRGELLRSEKDHAEHAMIVDLERNDLNRVCRPGTVTTQKLAEHHSFPTVHHLVSTVNGELRSDVTPGQLFRSTFPGGSITGAPKHTAVRLIDRLETRQRGIYTGTIGFWDLDRAVADWNIAIRTLVRSGKRGWWDSGGGIVIDSDPESEYRESLDKLALIRRMNRPNDRGVPERLRGGGSDRGGRPMV